MIAALLNGRARKVTPAVVDALRATLPGSTILESADITEARAHVRTLADQRPDVVLVGGGDGSIMRLLNQWRETGVPFPTLALLRLGTGNAWARTVGAPEFAAHLKQLPKADRLPTVQFGLIEVENLLCQFAGVGWDARILNDYAHNLEKRRNQLLGSRLAAWWHKGVRGYLYSVARITVPEEWLRTHREGQARLTLENLGPQVYGVSEDQPQRIPPDGPIYDGPVSVGAASAIPEWGYGVKAFPHALKKPGFINLRIYDGTVWDAVRGSVNIWRGTHKKNMHDFFVTAARMRFSRPMPFQIGGDPMGEREEIVFRAARETVRVVDWRPEAQAAVAG